MDPPNTQNATGSVLGVPDLTEIYDSTTSLGGWQQTQYADVGVGFVLQSAYMVFFMHCGFAMVSFSHLCSATG